MLLEAGILGGLSATGFLLTFSRLPAKAKAWILKYPLYTDIIATAATYKVLGMTLTALTAAGFMSCLISAGLFIPALRRKFLSRSKKAKNKDEAMNNWIKPRLMITGPAKSIKPKKRLFKRLNPFKRRAA